MRFSDIVARVRLIEVEERIFTLTPQQYKRWETSFNFQAAEVGFVPDASIYVPMIAFNFEVLDYLKGGNGAAKISALTLLEYGSSKMENEARAALTYYSDKRDKRWDDREAIVFLREVGNSADWVPDNHYYIGVFMGSGYSVETYSLDAYRQWYPASNGSGNSSAASEERQSFLVSPGDGGVSEASMSLTMRLSELRQLASLSDAELYNRFLEEAKDNMSEWVTARELKAMESKGEIILQWKGTDVRTQASGYRILRRSESKAEFTVLGDVSTNLMGIYEYKDTEKVEAGVEYTYIVRAVTAELHNGIDAQVALTISGVRATATSVPTDMPTPTATPNPVAFSVSASGLASWTYSKPAGATFRYYEVRWLPYDSTKDLNDWTGKQNAVIYNENAASYQIPNLTAGTQYKAKLFISVTEQGKTDATYVKSEVVLFTP